MTYDCFKFFNELDLLEIRLNTLNDVVDRFVIAEATRTYRGIRRNFFSKKTATDSLRLRTKSTTLSLTIFSRQRKLTEIHTSWRGSMKVVSGMLSNAAWQWHRHRMSFCFLTWTRSLALKRLHGWKTFFRTKPRVFALKWRNTIII